MGGGKLLMGRCGIAANLGHLIAAPGVAIYRPPDFIDFFENPDIPGRKVLHWTPP